MSQIGYDAAWIRQAASEAAEVIRNVGLGGGGTLAPMTELPEKGRFSEDETMELLTGWVGSAHRHHQFFVPGFIERLNGAGEDDDDEAGAADLPPLVFPTAEVRDGVGVVVVPGLKVPNASAEAARSFAVALDRLIRDLDDHVIGWVLDFASLHTGGNMHPMAAGLAGLLGTGRICGFEEPDGTASWVEISSHGVMVDGELSAEVPNAAELPRKPVAVAVGPMTTSAGEFVVLGLRSRVGARLFGTATAGYLSSVSLQALPCGAHLGVTSAVAIDAHGVRADDHLVPDVLVADNAIGAAINWINATAANW